MGLWWFGICLWESCGFEQGGEAVNDVGHGFGSFSYGFRFVMAFVWVYCVTSRKAMKKDIKPTAFHCCEDQVCPMRRFIQSGGRRYEQLLGSSFYFELSSSKYFLFYAFSIICNPLTT